MARRRAVASPTTIVPGSASDWIRAATLVASPRATAPGSAAPTSPTAACPLLIATLTAKTRAPGRLDVARVLGDDLEDAQASPGGALRIVVVGSRHAEVRADPVSLVRLHHAAVLLDGAAHHRHALADERLHLVDREPLPERGRADDVREQDRSRGGLRRLASSRRSWLKYPRAGVANVTAVIETSRHGVAAARRLARRGRA